MIERQTDRDIEKIPTGRFSQIKAKQQRERQRQCVRKIKGAIKRKIMENTVGDRERVRIIKRMENNRQRKRYKERVTE